MIHPTAMIDPGADLDPSVEIGPYTVIDAGVVIGADCTIGPHCHFTGLTRVGTGNRFHAGCVIGDAPQDLKYTNEPTALSIGNDNVFREHATVHRSNQPEEKTVVGSHNFLMANSHIGHNARVGDHVILANGALVSGHVVVQSRAFISGCCLIHQFVRVGELALMQGGAAISKDLPPFTIARGYNGICGLNVVGLRRAGIGPEDRQELKRLYHLLFRSRLRFQEALRRADTPKPGSPAALLLQFVTTAKRGLCADTSRSHLDQEGSD
jgi:UDP-N-acetylglucosamine acyltransferase